MHRLEHSLLQTVKRLVDHHQVLPAGHQGRWRNQPVWGGMQDGLVQLSAVHARLPAALKAELAQRQQALLAGRLQPFAAPLVDNAGRLRLATGALDDAAISRMDWLVQGVAGGMPASR